MLIQWEIFTFLHFLSNPYYRPMLNFFREIEILIKEKLYCKYMMTKLFCTRLSHRAHVFGPTYRSHAILPTFGTVWENTYTVFNLGKFPLIFKCKINLILYLWKLKILALIYCKLKYYKTKWTITKNKLETL